MRILWTELEAVEDRGMARAIVNGHEQQNLMKAAQLQASTHYHVFTVLLHTCSPNLGTMKIKHYPNETH